MIRDGKPVEESDGPGTGISRANKTRYMREYQAKRRGSRSYKSESEDAAVLIALAMGEISEGSAAAALGMDRVAVRDRLQTMTRDGCDRANVPCKRDSRLDVFEITAGVGM